MNRPETVSALSLRLPQADRSLETYKLSAPKSFPDTVSGPMNTTYPLSATVKWRITLR